MTPLYFNNSEITKPVTEAVSKMIPFLTDDFFSPYGTGDLVEIQRQRAESALKPIYDFVGAGIDDNFTFVSSAEEAVAKLLFAVFSELTTENGKNQFLAAEESLPYFNKFAKSYSSLGVVFKFFGGEGKSLYESILPLITPRTGFISVPLACGLTGVQNDLSEIVALCKEREIFLHVDMNFAIGKMAFDFANCGFDAITFEGSLLHAPLGAAALFTSKRFSFHTLKSLYFPGALFFAFSEALKEEKRASDYTLLECARMRQALEKGLCKNIPGVEVIGGEIERLPTITALSFPHLHAEALYFYLMKNELYATLGGGNLPLLRNLLEMKKYPKEIAHSALSFSLSRFTNDTDIERAITLISETVQKMQKIKACP